MPCLNQGARSETANKTDKIIQTGPTQEWGVCTTQGVCTSYENAPPPRLPTAESREAGKRALLDWMDGFVNTAKNTDVLV